MKRHGSLNHIFRLVWSQAMGCWVAVAENTRGRGKSASRKLIAATLSLSGVAALAAPGGGQVVAGSAGIAQSGPTTTITQTSQNLSLNWKNFNIGATETVNFVQPGVSSLAVNRILDTSGSQILGRLNANGQVFLINPNGILFGRGAQVNVGGLVASTLDFNQAGIDGNIRSFSGNGAGSIVNQGTIHAASGGYVALLGNRVSNQGTITAPLGSVVLGAGSAATLTFSGNHLTSFEIDQSVLDSLAENGGLIQADGGMVILNAGAKAALQQSMVSNTGVILARTVDNQPGNITVLGGMAAGTANIAGTLDASAPDGGNGGFIDTSAAHVKIADAARVTTLAANGKTGTWLIDPTDFTISSGGAAQTASGIGADALVTSLGSNNVVIATVAGGAEKGDINVNAAVAWNVNKLTLSAHNDININAVMTAKNSASLDLQPASGKVNVGFNPDGSFKGRVDFLQADGTARTGTGFLTIGANGYTVIATAANLSSMASGTHYALGGNIDAGAFTSIANFNNSIFDGLGHTISGLAINGNGLFGLISNTTIRNVGLIKNSSGNGSVSGVVGTGALVGSMSASTVSNSYSDLNVTGDTSTGGLVGRISAGATVSNISNSHATGIVTGTNSTGGLIGSIAAAASSNISNISNSYATGAVTATGAETGGLVGYINNNSGTISYSHATGDVRSKGANTGGLVGSNGSSGGIDHSYAIGYVEGIGASTGGLVGSNDSGAITLSYSLGNVSGGGADTGGLVGTNSGAISQSFAIGDVTGKVGTKKGAATGGLVGSNTGTLTDTYAAGNISGYAAGVGGLVGDNSSGTVGNSYAAGTVTGEATATSGVGGLIGIGTGTNNSYRAGSVSILSAAPLNSEGMAATSADLKSFPTSINNPNWNFNGIWKLPESTNTAHLYPILSGLSTTITATANDQSKTYDGMVYSGTNSIKSIAYSANGNSGNYNQNTALYDTATYGGGTSVAAINAATYDIKLSNSTAIGGTAANALYTANGSASTGLSSRYKDFLNTYTTVKYVAGTLTVNKAALGINAVTDSKVYNGNAQSGGVVTTTGLIAGDIVTASQSYGSKNVLGSGGSTLAVNAGYTVSDGNGGNNYSTTLGTAAGTITKANLAVTGISADNKVYNANTAATLSGAATVNAYTGDVVTVGGTASGVFADKNVADGKAVTLSGNTIGGLDAGNYNLVQQTGLTAGITARVLTALLTGEIRKIYDGNNEATLAASNYQLGNVATGESIGVNKTSGTYNSANVLGASTASTTLAAGDFVAGSGTVLSNYSLPVAASGSAGITARMLTAILTGEISKIYDGNDKVTLAGSNFQLGNFAGAESASVSKSTGTYNSANVVNASTVSTTLAAGDFVAGSDTSLSNYSLPVTVSGSAGITPKALTVDTIANNKVYDGNAIASLNGAGGGAVKIEGLVAGETLNLSGQFDNPNVGKGKTVTVAGVSTDSALASDYTVTQPVNLKADITAVLVAAGTINVVPVVPVVLRLSPQVKVIGSSNVADVSSLAGGTDMAGDSSVALIIGASRATVDNAAELSLNMEKASWSDKIIPSTMLGLSAILEIVGDGLQLNNPSITTENNK